ncbi:protein OVEREXPRESSOR OF CATIONIC PEROXIDASE 3-like [Camellia sinensis]|nr:protein OVEREXPRESSOR OF CATIONIC PEROXIDASE 3-like [Camellia sinensis]
MSYFTSYEGRIVTFGDSSTSSVITKGSISAPSLPKLDNVLLVDVVDDTSSPIASLHDEEEGNSQPTKVLSCGILWLRLIFLVLQIKNLAADVCLDRAVVLQLLRDPPPSLLLMSAALPDKPISVISEPESKPLEEVSSETAADVAQPEAMVNLPVHVMQKSWSARKRLKKVQVETLERVFDRTKRPTNAMISSIVHVTNLPRKKVVKWFEDKRAEHGVPDHRLPYQRSAPETVFNS